jgi:hypothetical protein
MKSLKTKIRLNIEQVIVAYLYIEINSRVRWEIEDAIVPTFPSNKPRMQILNQVYKIRIQNNE